MHGLLASLPTCFAITISWRTNLNVVKEDGSSWLRLPAHLGLVVAEAQAWHAFLHQQAAHATGSRIIIRAAHDQVYVSDASSADERFRAVENVMIALQHLQSKKDPS